VEIVIDLISVRSYSGISTHSEQHIRTLYFLCKIHSIYIEISDIAHIDILEGISKNREKCISVAVLEDNKGLAVLAGRIVYVGDLLIRTEYM